MPTKVPCHQAEWHHQQQPGRRRWQQHTVLTGMSTEMQLRPLTAYRFWRSVLRGKSFNRPDFKYFSNLPNHICFPKWRVLMFKQSIRTTWTNFTEHGGEFDLTPHRPLHWSPDMSTEPHYMWPDWHDFSHLCLCYNKPISFKPSNPYSPLIPLPPSFRKKLKQTIT